MGRARAESYARNYQAHGGYGVQTNGHANDDRMGQYWQQAAMQEAARVAEGERRRLEAEMQAKLDQVGAELELIESINRREVRGLKWRVFLMFVLAAAIGSGAGWLYKKKLKPQADQLQTIVRTQQIEQDRLGMQLREQTEKTHAIEEHYLAAKMELDRLKPKGSDAAKSTSNAAPAEPKQAAPIKSPSPPPPSPPAPAAAAAAKPPAATATPPSPPKKVCNCRPGDPMCGCI
ncbi:MAG TPA: hypothetical protein VF881_01555 [Polyangiaceae bacterium]